MWQLFFSWKFALKLLEQHRSYTALFSWQKKKLAKRHWLGFATPECSPCNFNKTWLYKSLCGLSVSGNTPPLHWKPNFWAAQAILSNFFVFRKFVFSFFLNFFSPNFFFTQIFFSSKIFFLPKIFFHLQKHFPTFNFLYISGCFMLSWVLKKISPKIFLGEARRDTMLVYP